MFARLRSLISADAVVELRSDRIRVREIPAGKSFEFEPLLSIDAASVVVSVGRPIPTAAVKTYAPFAGPEALAEHSRMGELLLAFAYSKLGSSAWVKPAPRVVIAVADDPHDEAGRIRDEVLLGLSASAGARLTVIHRGRPLSEADAMALLASS